MEFAVLGPLEVRRDGGDLVAVRAAKERVVLALLVLSANRAVSADQLVEGLWGDRPPDQALTTLRAYVSRVRKALGDPDRIVTTAGGYRLEVRDGECDAARFEALVAAAHDATPSVAASLLDDALALWRGPAFAELADVDRVRPEAARLDELRLSALEAFMEAQLARGHHHAIVSDLEAACAAHPLRERLWASWMVALYRSGRHAEALRAYEQLRGRLADELGLVPSPTLVELQRAILDHDQTLQSGTATALPTGVVTFVLTDVEGSTPLWDAVPAAMDAALAAHDRVLADLVASSGGVLLKAKGEGDATLSVFRRATDALAAATAIHAHVADATASASVELRVRVAVHTGEAYERDGDYYGPTLNRAARFRALAAGGQTLLSASTAELVRDHLPAGYTLVDLGRRELRGITRPEHLFALVHEGDSTMVPAFADETPADGSLLIDRRAVTSWATPDVLSPLPSAALAALGPATVGREQELSTLADTWKHAQGGTRCAVFISGEAGIGKTRLAAEMAARAHGEGATVLWGRCDEDLPLPYQPIAQALEQWLVSADPQRAAWVTEGDLARLLPSSSEARVVAGAERDSGRLIAALREFVLRLTERGPVVLVADDLHWADDDTLQFLRHLVRDPTPSPLLVMGTFRHTDVDPGDPLSTVLGDLRREPNADRLVLSGLDVEAVVDLLEASTGWRVDESARRTAAMIHADTNGNPFFVGEVVRHLLDTGTLAVVDGQIVAATPIADLGLPERVRDVVGRRLAALSPAARTALSIAAVAGHEFDLATIEAVNAEAGDDTLDAIEEAIGAGVVRELTRPGQFSFAHALVRQTLLSELTAPRRARLHRRVADALAAVPNPDPVRCAHHYIDGAAAGAALDVATWSLRAVDRLWDQLAFEAAIAIADRAIAVLANGDTSSAARAELLARKALIMPFAGRNDDAKAIADEAAAAARLAGDVAVFCQAVEARAQWAPAGDPDLARGALLDEALAWLGDGDAAQRSRLLSCRGLWRAVSRGEGAAAEDDMLAAVGLAWATDDPATLMNALVNHCLVLMGSSDLARQRAVYADLVRGFDTLPTERRAFHTFDLARIGAVIAMQAGDRPGVEAAIDEATYDKPTDITVPTATAAMWKAMLALAEGRFDDAEALSAALLKVEGDVNFRNSWAGLTGRLVYERGSVATVVPVIEATVETTPDLVLLRAVLCQAYAESGQLDAARALFDDLSRDGFAVVPRDLSFTATLAHLVDVAAILRDPSAAAALHELLVPYAGQLVVVAWGVFCAGAVDRFLAMCDALCGRDGDADACFAAAVALEESISGSALVTRTQFWWARFLHERNGPGDRDRARALAAGAHRTATNLGMVSLAAGLAAID